MHAAELALSLLLVVIAVNVAILVYARTAARAGEIAVRTALGASRRRIVTQLFAESLVSSGVAAVLGLMVAAIALHEVLAFQQRATGDELPFWMHLGISPGVVAYAIALAMLAAVIVGVLPALKATGRRVQSGLQQLSSRGSGLRLGRTWTVLIVAQVAVAVAALPFAVHVALVSLQRATVKPVYPAGEILRTSLSMEREESPPAAGAEAYERAIDVALSWSRRRACASPRGGTGRHRRHDLERVSRRGRRIRTSASRWNVLLETLRVAIDGALRSAISIDVDTAFLAALDLPMLSGRRFGPDDVGPDARAVVVDRMFAQRVIGDDNVLGRRIRTVRRTSDYRCGQQPKEGYACAPVPGTSRLESGPWLEIVGVMPAIRAAE